MIRLTSLLISTIFLALTALTVPNETVDQIGQLKLTDSKIKKTETTVDSIAGLSVKVTRLTVTAKTKVQVSCNYGNPDKNEYKTIDNKVAISYAYDSTGIIYKAIISEIKNYITEQEAWAKKYNSGSDFSLLPFYKSFFLKDSIATPFIWTGAENPGDYKLFYIDKQVYKIELLSRYGYGNLSSFVGQHMYFIKDNKQLDLGNYIKNIDKAKEILSKIN